MDKELIERLAQRFLQYRLPDDFRPDNGVIAVRPNYAPNIPWHIYGTNLLDADQAKEMVLFMVEGLPAATQGTTDNARIRSLCSLIERFLVGSPDVSDTAIVLEESASKLMLEARAILEGKTS